MDLKANFLMLEERSKADLLTYLQKRGFIYVPKKLRPCKFNMQERMDYSYVSNDESICFLSSRIIELYPHTLECESSFDLITRIESRAKLLDHSMVYLFDAGYLDGLPNDHTKVYAKVAITNVDMTDFLEKKCQN